MSTQQESSDMQTLNYEGVDSAGPSNEGDQTILISRKRPIEEEADFVPPLKRFTVVSSDDQHKWNLPQDMAEYANEHMQTFIPEKDVSESIMLPNPVPSNIDTPQKVDDFLVSLMTKNEIAQDASFEKIQQKITNIFGPLSKVWHIFDTCKNSDDTSELSFEDLMELSSNVEKTILLVGQAFQATAYHRRFNALNSVMKDQRKVKETLREKSDLLKSEHKFLFGEKFQHHIAETAKAKQKSEELFKAIRPPTKSTKPFRPGPPAKTSSAGGQSKVVFSRRQNNGYYRGSGSSGQSSSSHYQRSNYYNQGKSSQSESSRGTFSRPTSESPGANSILQCSSRSKGIVFRRNSCGTAIGRKDQILQSKLGKINPGSKYSLNCEWISHPIHKGTCSDESSSRNKNVVNIIQ